MPTVVFGTMPLTSLYRCASLLFSNRLSTRYYPFYSDLIPYRSDYSKELEQMKSIIDDAETETEELKRNQSERDDQIKELKDLNETLSRELEDSRHVLNRIFPKTILYLPLKTVNLFLLVTYFSAYPKATFYFPPNFFYQLPCHHGLSINFLSVEF